MASKQKPRAEQTDVPPGSNLSPKQADRQNDSAKDQYYLFGPDRRPIGPDGKPLATGDYQPSASCKEVLSDYDEGTGEPRKYAKGTECEDELKALGNGGPPAGSKIVKVPAGHRRAARPTEPRISRRTSGATTCSKTTRS